MDKKSIKTTFMEKAGLVSSFLYEVKTMEEAFLLAIDLCEKKQPCINLYDTENEIKIKTDYDIAPEFDSGSSAAPDFRLKFQPETQTPKPRFSAKTIAAPDLSSGDFTAFEYLCRQKSIDLVKTGLRQYPGGIDMGFTIADFGIAETGTLVISSDNEDTRLAAMLSEFHVVLLPESKIRAAALDMTEELKELIHRPSSYTAFITGASRTADIERVLAIGVHGPLELHIIIIAG